MRLTFLGKSSDSGESPTLYATDHDSYVIQGYRVTDPELLARLEVADGEAVVEVYARLFQFLAEDGVNGTVTSWVPPIVYVKENGNCIIRGSRLTDDGTRSRMCIPDHEDAIEVAKSAVLALV